MWTKGGKLFTFGAGDRGQLGHLFSLVPGDQHEVLVPRVVAALSDQNVAGASAGGNHTVVWTDSGDVFTFGLGYYGALGYYDYDYYDYCRIKGAPPSDPEEYCGFWGDGPRRVDALSGKTVVGAAAGSTCCVVWTDEGELFIFGILHAMKLSTEPSTETIADANSCRPEPRLVEALAGEKVIGASAGDHHIAVWTNAGELFTFGDGGRGALGHGAIPWDGGNPFPREASELVPRLVEALSGKTVVGASASSEQTVIWTASGALYTCGRGTHGVLGHGEDAFGTISLQEEDEFVPRQVKALSGKKVMGASVSPYHTVAWTSTKEIFTFGWGFEGNLGHGGTANDLEPRRVEAFETKYSVGKPLTQPLQLTQPLAPQMELPLTLPRPTGRPAKRGRAV